MITGTFNGLNVIALPALPGFSQVELSMHDKVSAAPSVFSQAAQTLDWQIDWWDGKMSLPPMHRKDAQAWIAFQADCVGMAGCFMIGDQLASAPSGQAIGVPLVSGVNLTRANLLNTKGWRANEARQLKAGDYFQIGSRLHLNLDDLTSDGSGNATIRCWPRIREAPANGDKIILHYPKGLFRLSDNARKYSLSNSKMCAIDLSITECL